MKKNIRTYLVFFGVLVGALLFVFSVSEQKIMFEATNVPQEGMHALTAESWGVFNPDTGDMLYGASLDAVLPIASITKLFTAYAALTSERTDSSFVINWHDLYTEGRAGKLRHGEHTTPRALLFPLLIESSNDAGEAIKRALAGEFFTSIHSVFREAELHSTKIVDGSGLSPGNVSTASDLALFLSYLRNEYPHILDITQLYTYVSEDVGLVNNDPARELKTFTGGKHGFTYEAGNTFVGTFSLPETKEEVGIVLLGSDDLRSDIMELLQHIGDGG